jgi:hypothetical protein
MLPEFSGESYQVVGWLSAVAAQLGTAFMLCPEVERSPPRDVISRGDAHARVDPSVSPQDSPENHQPLPVTKVMAGVPYDQEVRDGSTATR